MGTSRHQSGLSSLNDTPLTIALDILKMAGSIVTVASAGVTSLLQTAKEQEEKLRVVNL